MAGINEKSFDKLFYQSSLISAKFIVPRLHKQYVSRSRLIEILDEGLRKKVTLVVSPAGSGKTMLVADWVQQKNIPYSWVSLDSTDNNALRFWRILLDSLQRISPGIVRISKSISNDKNSIPVKLVVTALIECLYEYPTDSVIVLDDYNVIQDPVIHESLSYFIQNLPEKLHLVILSRSETSLPLARMRAEGQVIDVKREEISFNAVEIVNLFEKQYIKLSSHEAHMLETSTEGWATGILFTIISLKQNGWNPSGVLNFKGNQYIFKYFEEEVFQYWPEHIQTFLLKTSILDTLSGPICDAVTSESNSGEILKKLSRTNSFIMPIDNEGTLYRYHYLFARFLNLLLKKKQNLLEAALYRLAASWYENNLYIREAIQCYIKSQDYEKAAALIAKKAHALLKAEELNTLMNWLMLIPESLLKENRMLCLVYAWLLVLKGREEESELWLKNAEATLRGTEGINAGREEEERIRGEIYCIKAFESVSKRDVRQATGMLKEARRCLPGGSSLLQNGICFNEGEATLLGGRLGMYGMIRNTHAFYRQAYHMVDCLGRDDGYGQVLFAEILYEKNQIRNALTLLTEGLEKAEHVSNAGALVPAYYTLARIEWANHDMEKCIQTINEAETKIIAMNALHWLPIIRAIKTRFWLQHGEKEQVDNWYLKSSVTIHDGPEAAGEFMLMTLARVLIFKGLLDEAIFLLGKLLSFSQREKRLAGTIEILNLEAIAFDRWGEKEKAVSSLKRALALGEKEGYVRSFIDEGEPILLLLQSLNLCKRGHNQTSTEYTCKLLHLLKNHCELTDPLPATQYEPENIGNLTAKELEVLKLIAEGLTNQDICGRLGVKLSTIRTHTTNIYSKLQVSNRTHAVRRGRELNVI